ncbi:hypothetical protein [Salipiger sp.]
MQASRVGHALYRSLGGKAEAEAARHVREEQRKGRDAEAEKWRSVQAAIRQIRGPLQS